MAQFNIPPGFTAILVLIATKITTIIFSIKLFHPHYDSTDETKHPNQSPPSPSPTEIEIEKETTTATTTSTTASATTIFTPKINQETLRWYFTSSPTSVRAKATAILALPFWIWAICKIISSGEPDGGGLTFGLVILSCFFVVYTHPRENENENENETQTQTENQNQNQNQKSSSQNRKYQKCASISLLISNILLTLNYLLPIFFTSYFQWPWSLSLYVFIGGVYWAYMCVWNWRGYDI